MTVNLEVLSIGLVLLPFAFGARQDYRTRLVDDRVWWACLPGVIVGVFTPYFLIRLVMSIVALSSMWLAHRFKGGGSADIAGFPIFVWVLGPIELAAAIMTLPIFARLTDWKKTPLVTCMFGSLVVGLVVSLIL